MMPLPKGRPTFCAVDLHAVRHNFRQVRKRVGPGVKVLSVLKANAYGHGALEVARVLEEEGSDGFGVATVEEGVGLRQENIRSPILVLAGIYPEQVDELLEHRLTPVIGELEIIRKLESLTQRRGAKLDFHLKLDTGMGRIGFLPDESRSWLPEIAKLKALKFEGVLSIFSHADSPEGSYTESQLEIFKSVINHIRAEGFHPPLIHIANSAAVITLPASYFTLVRPGLMLYGAYPALEMTNQVVLKPALSWKTRIMQLKRLPKGSSISYGRSFVTRRESLIAILPLGYADGYHRLLSNRGAVLVRGKRAPVAGRICMDLTMVDVTDIGGVEQGDEVVLLGRQGAETISADEMARWAETISYEIFTSISSRVPRIHYSS
jgi:alanine racemase